MGLPGHGLAGCASAPLVVIPPVYGRGYAAQVSSPTVSGAARPMAAGTLGAVAVGGAVGALLRWLLELALPAGAGWPDGPATLLANVLGSAALAWLVVHEGRRALPGWVRPGVGTGLLGGFTTFSTYAVQVAVGGRTDPLLALAYLVLTPVLCVAAAAVAGTLARRPRRAR